MQNIVLKFVQHFLIRVDFSLSSGNINQWINQWIRNPNGNKQSEMSASSPESVGDSVEVPDELSAFALRVVLVTTCISHQNHYEPYY